MIRASNVTTLAAVLAALLLAPILAPAQGTHLWTQSKLEEFEKGTPEGVALQSDGHLRQASIGTASPSRSSRPKT
jgi:hypothetical protein